MQGLPGHALTDPKEHIKEKSCCYEILVQRTHITTTFSSKHTHTYEPGEQAEEVSVISGRNSTTQCNQPSKLLAPTKMAG